MPVELHYLWVAFGRLSDRRGSSGFGVMPLNWSDIDAFKRVTSTRLNAWEVEVIEMLDRVYLDAAASHAKAD